MSNWPCRQDPQPKPECHRQRICATRREAEANWILTVGPVPSFYGFHATATVSRPLSDRPLGVSPSL